MRALLALVGVLGLRYPCQAMNACGERILIFGDSLTQHAGGGNPVWNVDQGSQRQHSGPGDLLASLLLEQGAQAVRTDALVSRSAFNFWTREAAQNLIAADLAWKPTKIVFVLGTNDVGLASGPDEAAFVRLRDAYKPSGAELWAIGPFKSRLAPAGIDQVAATMRKVFGSRFIDGRPLSALISNGPDGVHYEPTGARLLALNMADALLSTSPVKPWMGLAIGMAIVVGGGLAYSLWTRSSSLHGLEIVDGKRWGGSVNELIRGGHRQVPCKSGLDRSGNVRCWSRGLGAAELPPGGAFLIAEAAEAVGKAGRFGSRKVFIGDLYDEVRRRGVDISLDDFKRELLRMLREGDVLLTRADLVGAMDRDRVKRSGIHDMGSDFHFVTLR